MIARDPSLEESIRSAIGEGRAGGVGRRRGLRRVPGVAARPRRLHGGAGRRSRRRPRPDRRPAARAADARRAGARHAVHPRRRRPGAGRHGDPDPGAGPGARHGPGRTDEPHRHPRPKPRASRRSSPAPAAASLREGELVEVDGGDGPDPRSGSTPDEAAETNRGEQARRAARAASRGTGRTADGHPVALLLNIGDASGAAAVAKVDAEGVGLFRTEFLYLDRQDAPSVDEQVALYTGVLGRDGRPQDRRPDPRRRRRQAAAVPQPGPRGEPGAGGPRPAHRAPLAGGAHRPARRAGARPAGDRARTSG